MNQRQKLLTAFIKGEKLTTYSAAVRKLSVTLTKRICDFQNEGYVFHKVWSDGVKCKKHKIYFLDRVKTPAKLLKLN